MPAKAKTRGAEGKAAAGAAKSKIEGGIDGSAPPPDWGGATSARANHDLVAVRLAEITDPKAREASFRLLFDGNPIPTALCDPESYGFLAVNEAAAAMWGFSRDELLRMSLFDVALKEDWTRCAAARASLRCASSKSAPAASCAPTAPRSTSSSIGAR